MKMKFGLFNCLNCCFSCAIGTVSACSFAYAFLLQLSNLGASLNPDGLPLDPKWKIYLGFGLSLLLAIVAYMATPNRNKQGKFEHFFR